MFLYVFESHKKALSIFTPNTKSNAHVQVRSSTHKMFRYIIFTNFVPLNAFFNDTMKRSQDYMLFRYILWVSGFVVLSYIKLFSIYAAGSS